MKKKVNNSKAKLAKEKNKIEEVGSFDTDVSKIIYIIVGVAVVFGLFYLITLLVLNKDTKTTKTDEEVQILKGEKNNTLGIILRAGTGVKIKQMGEVLCNGGYKPTLSGETIALAINSNTMIGGLQKVSALAIDAKAARKSLDKLLAIKNYPNCGELLVA